MRIVETETSTDGKLKLLVTEAKDGSIQLGFADSDWHTHPDIISSWLSVPESQAIETLLTQITTDQLPIIISTDGGVTIEPWISDNHQATLNYFGEENCIVRFWSGVSANPSFKRDALKRAP